jgi:hypothetical protein
VFWPDKVPIASSSEHMIFPVAPDGPFRISCISRIRLVNDNICPMLTIAIDGVYYPTIVEVWIATEIATVVYFILAAECCFAVMSSDYTSAVAVAGYIA